MLRFWLMGLVLAALAACGGKGAKAGGEDKVNLDADPLALLPAQAIVVANIDARALYASGAVGAPIAALTDALVPIGAAAGFQPSRDVDRVLAATYGAGDVAAILRGRFDPSKMAQAAQSKSGAPIARALYAGRTMYTADSASYAVLTPATLVAGTPAGVQRVLDRVKGRALPCAVPPWAIETLATPGAQVAIAADFATQPIASAAIGSMSLPWLHGLKVARIVGKLGPAALDVAGTLTYSDAAQAQSGAAGVHLADGWLKILGPLLGGLTLQNLQVKPAGRDLQCSFSVDVRTLGNLLALAPRWLSLPTGRRSPTSSLAPSPPPGHSPPPAPERPSSRGARTTSFTR